MGQTVQSNLQTGLEFVDIFCFQKESLRTQPQVGPANPNVDNLNFWLFQSPLEITNKFLSV